MHILFRLISNAFYFNYPTPGTKGSKMFAQETGKWNAVYAMLQAGLMQMPVWKEMGNKYAEFKSIRTGHTEDVIATQMLGNRNRLTPTYEISDTLPLTKYTPACHSISKN